MAPAHATANTRDGPSHADSGRLPTSNPEIPMTIEKIEHPESNPDPITGAPGAHPVGVGLGAAAGGIAAGAAAGTLAAGPIGTVVGAAIGAVVGGLAGKGAAESVNPTQDLPEHRENDLRLGTGAEINDRTFDGVAGQSYSAVARDGVTGQGLTAAESHLTDESETHSSSTSTDSRRFPGSEVGAVGAGVGSDSGDAYWRANYRDEPYYSSSRSYDDYAPAYRLAHQRRAQYGGSYDAAERQLATEWERAKGVS